MSWLEMLRLLMLVTHFIGLGAVIGPFLLQLRRSESLQLTTMLVGAVIQIVSGNALIASRRLQGLDVIDEKMIIKLAVALLVLGAVILARVIQHRARGRGHSDHGARPWMLAGGGLAVTDLVIAAIWT